jgi:cytochrome c oxidase subunit 2
VIRTRRRLQRPLAASFVFALVLLATPLQALADTATPESPVSPSSKAENDVYFAILGVTITIFVLVGGFLLYSAIRFRARPGDDGAVPPQIHGSTQLEIGWTIVPVLILLCLAGYTLAKIPDTQDAPANALKIKVSAFQFGWAYTGTGGVTLPKNMPANTLVVPVGTPIELLLTSKDVIHDWWVPQLAPKVDVMPGQQTHTWFNAQETGIYVGRCAEFCGVGHPTMLIKVKVVSKEQWSQMGGRAA